MFDRGILTNNVVWGLFAYNPTFPIMTTENLNQPNFSRLYTERSRDGWSGLVSTVAEPGAHWTHEEGRPPQLEAPPPSSASSLPHPPQPPPCVHPVHQDACVLALEHFDPGLLVRTTGPPPASWQACPSPPGQPLQPPPRLSPTFPTCTSYLPNLVGNNQGTIFTTIPLPSSCLCNIGQPQTNMSVSLQLDCSTIDCINALLNAILYLFC